MIHKQCKIYLPVNLQTNGWWNRKWPVTTSHRSLFAGLLLLTVKVHLCFINFNLWRFRFSWDCLGSDFMCRLVAPVFLLVKLAWVFICIFVCFTSRVVADRALEVWSSIVSSIKYWKVYVNQRDLQTRLMSFWLTSVQI